MKHWQETDQILRRLAELEAAGRDAVLATVISIAGSAYRRPGARFLIEDEGATLGSVSGGCLEEDVRRVGLGLVGGEACRLLHYDTGSDDEDTVWGLGLGCNGEVEVFLQPTGTEAFRAVAGRVRALLEGQRRFALTRVVEAEDLAVGAPVVVVGESVVAGTSGAEGLDAEIAERAAAALAAGSSDTWSSENRRLFTEVLLPPPWLVVCGAGDDAVPLVEMAAGIGFRVVVVDHRPAYLEANRFPAAWGRLQARPEDEGAALPVTDDTFVVVKTHNLERDRGWVRRFLPTPAPYIGVLGPRDRRDEIVESVPAAERRRIYGPVGLDLGAEGPEQVAASIVAELLAARSGREPRHLRDREVSIHAEA